VMTDPNTGGDPSALAALAPVEVVGEDTGESAAPPQGWGEDMPDLVADPAVEVTEV
jgi:hypothetical protein